MIFFANSQGTTELVQSTPIYQGSSLANEITLVAPVSKYNSVTVAFKLADGNTTTEKLMTSVPLANSISFNGKQCNAWTYVVEQSITEKAGTVQVQFYIRNSNSLLASYGTQFQVQKGVAPILPSEPSQDIYEEIYNYLGAINQGVGYGIKSIRISAGNEFEFTNPYILNCKPTSNDPANPNYEYNKNEPYVYQNDSINPPETVIPYYSDYMGQQGVTGEQLKNGLSDGNYSLVAYNPKKNDDLNPPSWGFKVVSRDSDNNPAYISYIALYSNIFYKGLKDDNENLLNPDRYIIRLFKQGTEIKTVLVENCSVDFPYILNVNDTINTVMIEVINTDESNIVKNEDGTINVSQSTFSTAMHSSERLPIYEMDIFGKTDKIKYTITNYNDDTYEFEYADIDTALNAISNAQTTAVNAVENAKDIAISDIDTQVQKAKQSAANAKTSEENAESYYNNLISKENKIGGFPVLEDINGQPKIPSVLINQADIKEYIEITDEAQLDTITAQVGDVAVLVEDNTVTKSWILLSIDDGVRNWVIFGTSYATNAGHATTADSATNALKINGVQFRVMTEEEYDNSDKLGIIFVTYPNSEE